MRMVGTQIAEAPKRPRVLIVEDFVLIQESIRAVLQRDCDVVATVEDGKSAMAAVDEFHPDIVTLDVSLPDLSGFTLAEKLNEAHSPVKVIFITAYPDRAYAERAFEIGAKAYLLKASMHTELPAAIRKVMNGGLYRSVLIQ
jgi:DNA-binding NarL/FixJ family response regulator